jgi:hypothetical protein
MPATCQKSLARVNIPEDSSSVSSGASEEKGDVQRFDSYVGTFGDKIYVKNSNTLRLGFQNVGGFRPRVANLRRITLELIYINLPLISLGWLN